MKKFSNFMDLYEARKKADALPPGVTPEMMKSRMEIEARKKREAAFMARVKEIKAEENRKEKDLTAKLEWKDPSKIDASNPVVKKMLVACKKYGYKLVEAYAHGDSENRVHGHCSITLRPNERYHPALGRPGFSGSFRVLLNNEVPSREMDRDDFANVVKGLTDALAMIDFLNKLLIDGTAVDELPRVANTYQSSGGRWNF